MGNEFIVFLETKNNSLTARFDPKELPKIDAELSVSLDMKKILFFDVKTEERL